MTEQNESLENMAPPASQFGQENMGVNSPYSSVGLPNHDPAAEIEDSEAVPSSSEQEVHESEESEEAADDRETDPRLTRPADEPVFKPINFSDPPGSFQPLYAKLRDMFHVEFPKLEKPKSRKSNNSAPPPLTAGAKRPPEAVTEVFSPKRRKTDNQPPHSPAPQTQTPVVPKKRPAESADPAAKRLKSSEPASASRPSRDQSSTPIAKGVATKVINPAQHKGTGLYKRGNWAYASDESGEDQGGEKFTAEAKLINDITGGSAQKITRGSFRQLQSKLGFAGSAKSTPPTARAPKAQPRKTCVISIPVCVRDNVAVPGKSDRANAGEDHASPSKEKGRPPALTLDTQARGISIPGNMAKPAVPSTPQNTGRRPSTATSSSNRSTVAPEQPTRSTSRSTVPREVDAAIAQPSPDMLTKPKKTWNAIVYDVVFHGTHPGKPTMTYHEIVQGVRDRYPYFTNPGQSKTLESSPRNPLYSHPVFYKRELPNGSMSWGLNNDKPYIDRKTNAVLNANAPQIPVASVEVSDEAAEVPEQARQASTLEDTSEEEEVQAVSPKSHPRQLSQGSKRKADSVDPRSSAAKSVNGEEVEEVSNTNKRVRLNESVVPDSQQEPNQMSPPLTPRQRASTTTPRPRRSSSQATTIPASTGRKRNQPNHQYRAMSFAGFQDQMREAGLAGPRRARKAAPSQQARAASLSQLRDHSPSSSMIVPPSPQRPQSEPQPRRLSEAELNEQRRHENYVARNLVENFTDEELDTFIKEMKVLYFVNMDVKGIHVGQVLDIIFPTNIPRSSPQDLEKLAEDLRRDFEEHMWGSEWFAKFVTKHITDFNTFMAPNVSYRGPNRDKRTRLEFWLPASRFTRDTVNNILSTVSDVIDVHKMFNTKHWHEYVRKIYAEAADAMWEYRLDPETRAGSPPDPGRPTRPFVEIRKALEERYPEREGRIWVVPRKEAGAVEEVAAVPEGIITNVGGGEVVVVEVPETQV